MTQGQVLQAGPRRLQRLGRVRALAAAAAVCSGTAAQRRQHPGAVAMRPFCCAGQQDTLGHWVRRGEDETGLTVVDTACRA